MANTNEIFIELTSTRGNKFLGNVKLLQAVINSDESRRVIGWNNNGGIEVKETYDDIKLRLEQAGVTII